MNAEDKIRCARTSLLFNMPRDDSPCMRYALIPDNGEPTYKFVGNTLVYNDAYINGLSDTQVIQIFIDECY